MSDKDLKAPKIEAGNDVQLSFSHPVTPELLEKFHRARGIKTGACLRCGQNNYQIMSNEDYPASVLPMSNNAGDAQLEMVLPVIVLRCNNCGTLWTIDWTLFNEWEQAQEEREQGKKDERE
jgi:hypothetical protein